MMSKIASLVLCLIGVVIIATSIGFITTQPFGFLALGIGVLLIGIVLGASK